MMERYTNAGYDDGYYYGWHIGHADGRKEGYAYAAKEYETTLARYIAELEMLNARITYLENLTGGSHG